MIDIRHLKKQLAEHREMDDKHVAASTFRRAFESYEAYENTGELEQLDVAIDCVTMGSGLTGQGHGYHVALSFLAAILGSRFARSAKVEDLEEAIDTAR